MKVEILVPIALFASLALTAILFFYFRFRGNREVLMTIREAIAKGQELTPEVLERLGEPPRSPKADLRRGVISIFIALALVTFGFVLGEEDAVRPFLAIAAFPFLVGVAYLGLWRFGGNSR